MIGDIGTLTREAQRFEFCLGKKGRRGMQGMKI